MAKDKKDEAEGRGDSKADKATLAAEGVQEAMDEEQEQGFRGQKVDPTPNHAYSVDGVTSGEPTPETDADLAAEVAAMQRHVGGGQSAFTAEREPGEHE